MVTLAELAKRVAAGEDVLSDQLIEAARSALIDASSNASQQVTTALRGVASRLSNDEKQDLVSETYKQLPQEKQAAVMKTLISVSPPSSHVNDWIWKSVIGACVAIAAIAAIALVAAMYFPVAENGVRPELVLTLFTTVTAFMFGLFVKSPVAA